MIQLWLFRVLGIAHLLAGVMYLYWRCTNGWGESLFISLPFLGAELFTFVASISFVLSRFEKPFSPPPLDLTQDLTDPPYLDVFIICRQTSWQAVQQTARTAAQLDYPWHRLFIHIVDLSEEDSLQEVAKTIPCEYLRCPTSDPISYLLKDISTFGEYLFILDPGHLVEREFLWRALPYFQDPSVAYVQAQLVTVAHFGSNHPLQQVLLCNQAGGDIAPYLGSGVLVRRQALNSIQDQWDDHRPVLMGSLMHQQGWKSYLLLDVKVTGALPPLRNRWVALVSILGSLNLSLFLKGKATQTQRFQYLWFAFWSTSGLASMAYFVIPCIFLWFGKAPVPAFDSRFFLWFLPYLGLGRATLLAAFPQKFGSVLQSERQMWSQFFQSIQAIVQRVRQQDPLTTASDYPIQTSLGAQAFVLLLTMSAILFGSWRFLRGWEVSEAGFIFVLLWALYNLFLLSAKPADVTFSFSQKPSREDP
jgi:cellulose synthase (UDP-forming)